MESSVLKRLIIKSENSLIQKTKFSTRTTELKNFVTRVGNRLRTLTWGAKALFNTKFKNNTKLKKNNTKLRK